MTPGPFCRSRCPAPQGPSPAGLCVCVCTQVEVPPYTAQARTTACRRADATSGASGKTGPALPLASQPACAATVSGPLGRCARGKDGGRGERAAREARGQCGSRHERERPRHALAAWGGGLIQHRLAGGAHLGADKVGRRIEIPSQLLRAEDGVVTFAGTGTKAAMGQQANQTLTKNACRVAAAAMTAQHATARGSVAAAPACAGGRPRGASLPGKARGLGRRCRPQAGAAESSAADSNKKPRRSLSHAALPPPLSPPPAPPHHACGEVCRLERTG